MIVATFKNEFLSATVEFNGTNMHTVTYIRKGDNEEPFKNYVFNDDRESGEKDSIEMAKKFVGESETLDGK